MHLLRHNDWYGEHYICRASPEGGQTRGQRCVMCQLPQTLSGPQWMWAVRAQLEGSQRFGVAAETTDAQSSVSAGSGSCAVQLQLLQTIRCEPPKIAVDRSATITALTFVPCLTSGRDFQPSRGLDEPTPLSDSGMQRQIHGNSSNSSSNSSWNSRSSSSSRRSRRSSSNSRTSRSSCGSSAALSWDHKGEQFPSPAPSTDRESELRAINWWRSDSDWPWVLLRSLRFTSSGDSIF
jgi:hypothetical protein